MKLNLLSRPLRKPDDNFYIGLDCNGLALEPYRELADELAQERDGLDGPLKHRGEFHLTVMDPKELRKCGKVHPHLLTRCFPVTVENLEITGIGRVANDLKGLVAYYLVAEWPEAQDWRKSFGLDPKDFHITLGFIHGDVFGVSKGPETIVCPL